MIVVKNFLEKDRKETKMPTFLNSMIKDQCKAFLRDNEVQFEDTATRNDLVDLVRATLEAAGIDAEHWDFQSNRALIPAGAASNAVGQSYASLGEVAPPDRFLLADLSGPALVVKWDAWLESFEYYCAAAGFKNAQADKKRSLLLHTVGPEVQRVFKGLKEKENEPDVFKRALDALKEYFEPLRNPRYERFIFSKIRQNVGESFDSFVTRLRVQAKYCEFADEDDRLLDQLLLSCHQDKLRDRLLIKGKQLTLQDALMEARCFESVLHQSAVIKNDHEKYFVANEDSYINNLKHASEKTLEGKEESDADEICGVNPRAELTCWSCNKKGHIARFCRNLGRRSGITCFKCHKRGHTAGKCWQKSEKSAGNEVSLIRWGDDQ